MPQQFSVGLVEGVVLVESRLLGAEAVLNGEKFCERAVDLVTDDFFVCDEDVLEDGLVEFATDLVACAHVERVWVFEQSQVGLKELGPVAEVINHGRELGSKFVALPSDVAQAGSDLALRQRAVRREVEKVLFLGVEVDQMVLELLAQESLGCFSVGERRFHSVAHGRDEGGGEMDGLVVIFDCLLDPVDVGVRGIADVVLCADAEEVEVLATSSTDCSLEDESLDCVVFKSAATAVESAFEIVRMDATAFARNCPCLQEGLDTVEEFLVDERGVASVILLALEGDLP